MDVPAHSHIKETSFSRVSVITVLVSECWIFQIFKYIDIDTFDN